MSGDVFHPLIVPGLGDGRVVVQWDVLLALRLCDLFELFKWPITRITRLNLRQYIEAIYCASFKLFKSNVLCWRSIISEQMIREYRHYRTWGALQAEPVGIFK